MEGVMPTLVCVEPIAGAEAMRYPVAQARKIRQQQHHAGCWWHSCLGRREGGEIFSQMCQLTSKWKISYSDAFYRTDAFPCRERSSICLINNTVLPRLGVPCSAWALWENHDAVQCDVTKASPANTQQVKRHPCVLGKNTSSSVTSAK